MAHYIVPAFVGAAVDDRAARKIELGDSAVIVGPADASAMRELLQD